MEHIRFIQIMTVDHLAVIININHVVEILSANDGTQVRLSNGNTYYCENSYNELANTLNVAF